MLAVGQLARHLEPFNSVSETSGSLLVHRKPFIDQHRPKRVATGCEGMYEQRDLPCISKLHLQKKTVLKMV